MTARGDSLVAEMEFKKNDVVGKWRLEKQLGAGGQATVWRGRYVDDEHSPPAAIKICSGSLDKAKARFSRELDLLRNNTHPGIVCVRDSGVHQGQPYFSMELATTTLAHIAVAESTGTRLILVQQRASPQVSAPSLRGDCSPTWARRTPPRHQAQQRPTHARSTGTDARGCRRPWYRGK